jgi:hypothetical protein
MLASSLVPPRPLTTLLAALGVACAALAMTGSAAAGDKPTLSGQWTASPLTESWSVSDWGDACGPKPKGRGAGGGSVTIRQQGSELSIAGAGRAFSTAECWEQMPGLSRTSHSGGSRGWRTRCASAPNDPRRAAITTTLSATDSTIQMTEIGEFQFIIQDTTCRASVSRSRSFTLVRRDGDEPQAAPSATATAPAPVATAPTAAPAPSAPTPSASTPSKCSGAAGEPARLLVTPSRKLLRAGERFAFRALVTDAQGCATGRQPIWSIQEGPLSQKARIDARGAIAIDEGAGEGEIVVRAAVGDRGVSVVVEVAGGSRYDALLGEGKLNDAGEVDRAAVAVIAAGTIGGRTTVGEDAAKERKTRFVAIVAALSVALAFVALVMARRGKLRVDAAPPSSRAPSEGPASEGPASEGPASEGPVSEGPASEGPASEGPASEGPVSAAPMSGGPASGSRGPSGALDPGSPGPAPCAPEPGRAGRGKICPTCGERYRDDAEFCGKDATQLVLLN